MKCKEVRKRLPDYASEELKPEVNRIISSHLENCAECSALLDEMKSTMELIDKRQRLEPNPFLYTRITEKILSPEKSEVRTPVFRRILQPVMITLVMAAALFTGIKIGDSVVREQEQRISYTEETEYYLNDMQQESLEAYLLSDRENNNY